MIYGKDVMHLKQYSEGVEAENGDYIEGEAYWGAPMMCDADPAGKANATAYVDGVQITYSYIITLEVNAPSISVGDHILLRTRSHTSDVLTDNSGKKVRDNNQALIRMQAEREYTVKGFHRYSFQCKIWV